MDPFRLKYYIEVLQICFNIMSTFMLITIPFIDWDVSNLFPAIYAISMTIMILFNETFKEIWNKFKG